MCVGGYLLQAKRQIIWSRGDLSFDAWGYGWYLITIKIPTHLFDRTTVLISAESTGVQVILGCSWNSMDAGKFAAYTWASATSNIGGAWSGGLFMGCENL